MRETKQGVFGIMINYSIFLENGQYLQINRQDVLPCKKWKEEAFSYPFRICWFLTFNESSLSLFSSLCILIFSSDIFSIRVN